MKLHTWGALPTHGCWRSKTKTPLRLPSESPTTTVSDKVSIVAERNTKEKCQQCSQGNLYLRDPRVGAVPFHRMKSSGISREGVSASAPSFSVWCGPWNRWVKMHSSWGIIQRQSFRNLSNGSGKSHPSDCGSPPVPWQKRDESSSGRRQTPAQSLARRPVDLGPSASPPTPDHLYLRMGEGAVPAPSGACGVWRGNDVGCKARAVRGELRWYSFSFTLPHLEGVLEHVRAFEVLPYVRSRSFRI